MGLIPRCARRSAGHACPGAARCHSSSRRERSSSHGWSHCTARSLVRSVFQAIKAAPGGVDWKVEVSYVEIYLEKARLAAWAHPCSGSLTPPAQLRDLLNPDNDNLNIRESRDKGTYIEDVTEIVCSTWDEVQKVMQKGENNR